MPRLSLGLGVQAVSKVKSGGAAPSGLPYSSTNSINLVDASYPDQSGNYPKIAGYSNYTDELGITTRNQFGQTINGSLTYGYILFVFNVTSNRWELGVYESYAEGLAWSDAYASFSSNPSTNQSYIPTSGWSRNLIITAGV